MEGDQPLQEYRRKRDRRRTPEPFAAEPGGDGDGDGPIFVVQRHNARRLHYDLRLERDGALASWAVPKALPTEPGQRRLAVQDRKSTRLNSSHANISYAVFCLKKKNKTITNYNSINVTQDTH